MALPVDVRSLQALSDFRAALARSREDAKNALAAADMEISRMVDWLENNRRLYWEAEIRRRREDLSQAKGELFRKRTSRMFGHDGNLSEPHELVREAMRRLEEAEHKLLTVKKWRDPLQQAVMKYRASAQPLSDMVDSDLERAIGQMEQMIRAVEAYLADAAPSTSYVQAQRRQRASVARGEPPAAEEEEAYPEAEPEDESRAEQEAREES
jgi:hypothetical protein